MPYKEALEQVSYQKQWACNNRELIRKAGKKWRSKNPDKVRDKMRRHMAKRDGYAAPPPEADCPPRGLICDICNAKPDYALHLDHCHITGRFRGWLCAGCNTGLGKIERMGIDRIRKYLGL